jgi:hypothetical protein
MAGFNPITEVCPNREIRGGGALSQDEQGGIRRCYKTTCANGKVSYR